MTRSGEPSTEFERHAFGAIGATRTVVVLRTGATAMLDPDPAVTALRNVRILAIGLPVEELANPAAFGGETQAESTASTLATLARAHAGELPAGLVGYGPTGSLALLVAASLGLDIDRLALIAVPAPGTPLDRDDAAEVMARVTAETLIMNGQHDPDAAAAAARWHHEHLSASRVEMVPGAAVPAPDGRLALADVWGRVLTHVAPGTKSGS